MHLEEEMMTTPRTMAVFCGSVLVFVLHSGCSDDNGKTGDASRSDLLTKDAALSDKSPQTDKNSILDLMNCPARHAGQAQDKVEKYVLAENEVQGWIEDTVLGPPGIESGYTYDEIVAIIDGSQEPYAAAGCKGFAKQDYKNGDFTLALFIWEMTDKTAAKSIYDKDKGDLAGEGITGEVISCVYDEGVMGNDRMMWKGYVYKSQYIFKFVGRCKTMDQAPALKSALLPFVKALAEKLP
jgi:hypothetical protein